MVQAQVLEMRSFSQNRSNVILASGKPGGQELLSFAGLAGVIERRLRLRKSTCTEPSWREERGPSMVNLSISNGVGRRTLLCGWASILQFRPWSCCPLFFQLPIHPSIHPSIHSSTLFF